MVRFGKISRGVGYALASGVGGLLVVTAGVMFRDVAHNADMRATGVRSGMVFLTRALTMIATSFLGPTLYSRVENEIKLAGVMFLAAAVFFTSAFVSEELVFHLWFALSGFAFASIDVGTQILTRRTFGKSADPWLAFNLNVFSWFCAIASTSYFIHGLYLQGLVLAIFPLFVGIAILGARLWFGPEEVSPESSGVQKSGSERGAFLGWSFQWEGLEIDWLLLTLIFWTTAGQVTLCMYSYVYAAETNQVSAEEAGWLMVFFWVLIAVSRTMIFLQQVLGDRRSSASSQTLLVILGICLASGAFCVLIWAIMPRGNPWGLRIGLLGYAFFYAPITPFCFILSNRLGARTDQTAAMGIVGVNLGAGFGPMLYGAASGFAGASVLPWVVFFTFASDKFSGDYEEIKGWTRTLS